MSTPRLIIGKLDGIGRVRFSKPGYDVTDLALTNEQLVFDSAWSEILGVHQMSLDTGLLGVTQRTFGSYRRFTADVSIPTLPFAPLALGWKVDYNIQNSFQTLIYLKRYMPACMCTATNYIRLTSPVDNFSSSRFAYYVFNKPLLGVDAREAENGGGNSMILGNHPSRSAGLYISRRGADVHTCGDDDLTLSTLRPVLQVAESGVVSASVIATSFGNRLVGDITTSRPYPNHPPVLMRGATQPWGLGNASAIATSEYGWRSDTVIHFELTGGGTADPLHWTILEYDNDYVPGLDAAPTPRVELEDGVLKISKKNIDVRSAGESDLLLRTDRSVLHVKDRVHKTFLPGAAAGNIPLTTNISAPPIVIFGLTWNGENYCRPVGVNTTPLNTDWRITGPNFADNVRANATNSNQISFLGTAAAGDNFHAAVIEHS